ncbi:MULTISPECIES: cryptochrome/photolyase family protein [Empedobacter]|uniref:cryptochrome/photolyase family protein n=2 Tax=Weeksellaceae TaxID=2762318 RepID=UPI0025C50DAA|nr:MULTISPECIES: deoxyribodipyrimidine photo-lyase [unclassified Empedobacter]
MKNKISIFWFRRDLRLEDNVGLYHALSSGIPVLPIFIFDEGILRQLDDKKDRRVDYIHQALQNINDQLKSFGTSLHVYYGDPFKIFQQLSTEFAIHSIFCNRDYEPLTIKRDTSIYNYFKLYNISFKAFKDQVIFDKKDILKKDSSPYTVYTPYAKKWKQILKTEDYKCYKPDYSKFLKTEFKTILSLKEIGFLKTSILFKQPKLDKEIIQNYHKYRDHPALQCTTQLGIALRFGTISVRKCVALAIELNETWLNELIWREFFMQILYHFPYVVHQPFKAKYNSIKWRNNEQEFKLWCDGKTGYPIVDAGMRELNQTGFMHNRVRMITASFLCKHLLIDWRWGEAYFASKLNDYDLSANNGNWQWVAGSGCDAAPYFRVFNPTLQTEKFDKESLYIKKWVSEFETDDYPSPIVAHNFARNRVLSIFNEAFKK